MQHRSALLLDFFAMLDDEGVGYCVLGDTDNLLESITSDVDIVVPEQQIGAVPKLVADFCRYRDLRLVQCLQHEHNAYYFVVAFENARGDQEFLALDLCGNYFRRGRLMLLADELIGSMRPVSDASGHVRMFNACAPAIEFAYYLLKKIDKEDLQPQHALHLTKQWREDPVGAAAQIERFWGNRTEARLLKRAAESGDWSAVAKLAPRMRAALHRRIPLRAGDYLRELKRRWRRWRQPSGLLIAILGPDGSGKSSVISATERRIREVFRRTTIVHLRPGFLYRPERLPTRLPHAESPRTPTRSFLKLVFFAADYLLGYLFYTRQLLVRSNGLLFDRYYDDLLADPKRYRHSGWPRLARQLRRLVPRPHLWLLLDAPASVLQSRKQEVPFEESDRQRLAYRHLLHDQDHVAIIDAAKPLEVVVRCATTAILDRCEAQTRERLGAKLPERRPPMSARWLLFCCRHRIPLISKLTRVLFNSDIYCMTPRDLLLPHPYGIVIHSRTQLGRGVTVMQQVTIGGKDLDHNAAPIVGNGVYIGAGARVLGAITIGDGAIVGANAVVTRNVPPHATVVGANRIVARKAQTPPTLFVNVRRPAASGAKSTAFFEAL
jgi:serine acetyltransferase/thymidylate kinase